MAKHELKVNTKMIEWHYEKWKETNNVYHLFALSDVGQWLIDSHKLDKEQVIDIKVELLLYYDLYKEFPIREQLKTVLSNIGALNERL